MRSPRLASLAIALLCLAACSDDKSEDSPASAATSATGSGGAGGSSSSTGGSGAAPVTDDFEAGGDRPVTVHVPTGYDPSEPTPLLILLHGYSASGLIQNTYFMLEPVADARGLVYAYPDGTENPEANHFWNATDACCDFYGSGVDDVGYLLGLVDEISSKVNIDPARIFFAGHSNGGFMSYRLACEASDRIAAIISLAGANFGDPADCNATAPLSVLQIHGDADDTVPYQGGSFTTGSIPSALGSVAYFAEIDGCDPTPQMGDPIDLESGIDGAETSVQSFTGCDAGYAGELWTIQGGGHIPALAASFPEMIVDFALAHPKP